MTDEPKTLALGAPETGPQAQEARIVARYGSAAAASGTDIQKILSTTERMRRSGLMPAHVKSDEQAVIIALRGAEIGLPLIQAWHSMYVIQGCAAMEAKTMIALAYRHVPTFDFRIVSLTRDGCTAEARRSNQHSWVQVTFDKGDAQAAGLLNKSSWKQHRKAMYLARVQALLCRAVAPDTFQGLYTSDELVSGALQIEEGSVQDVDFDVSAPKDAGPAPDPLDSMSATSIVEMAKADGIGSEMAKARKALEIADDDMTAESLRRMYRHVQEQIDAGTDKEGGR